MRGETANKVLLRLKRGGVCSGEELAGELGVSRTAVWKAVKNLRSKGYEIVGGSARGYLLKECRKPCAETIVPASQTDAPLFLFSEVDSTNDIALDLLKERCPHLTAVAANAQRAGRGRVGRKFFSPAGTGIYMSVVIRNIANYRDLLAVTPAAAVAVARAIDEVFKIRVQIKWVNDLYLHGKKVSGILTQSMADEEGGVLGAVVGIGINVTGKMPQELKDKACSLKKEVNEEERDRLIGRIISYLDDTSRQLSSREFMDEYRRRSCILNKRVTFETGGITRHGVAVKIDDDGALYVRCGANEVKINSGEISLSAWE